MDKAIQACLYIKKTKQRHCLGTRKTSLTLKRYGSVSLDAEAAGSVTPFMKLVALTLKPTSWGANC